MQNSDEKLGPPGVAETPIGLPAEDAPTAEVHSRAATFWLVWSKSANRNPRFTHQSLADAQAEARRLAAKYPDRRWFVIQAVERVWVNEAEDRPGSTDDEIVAATASVEA